MNIAVIVSTTSQSLWENNVPEVVFTELRKHFEKVNRKQRNIIDTYFKRHDPILVSCFQKFYGNSLERCNYATIRFFHPRYLNHYKIIQQSCYLSCIYPEEVYLDKNALIKAQDDCHELKMIIENDGVLTNPF